MFGLNDDASRLLSLIEAAGIDPKRCHVLIVSDGEGSFSAEFNGNETSVWSGAHRSEDILIEAIKAIGIDDIDRLEDYP